MSTAAPVTPVKAEAGKATPPISTTRLKQIATDACTSALEGAEFYEHAKTAQWNSAIINAILKSLISESTTPPPPNPPSNSPSTAPLSSTSCPPPPSGNPGASRWERETRRREKRRRSRQGGEA
ncbi:hypothetical protein VC83_08581 [Pseudogymnoascus destructans]|uniref:Uncharacterized protein n=1 Tax=Pseudogymnoascus destructans TaxID=655981 RepID=A0A176ZY16_9PEZI|nr:uncharacterized protein VC83_08581 [Pseudogymnoascus destructans]OAF54925.1 hypothetical protein VC83_08581 [Pseudogymnoascus destructans]